MSNDERAVLYSTRWAVQILILLVTLTNIGMLITTWRIYDAIAKLSAK